MTGERLWHEPFQRPRVVVEKRTHAFEHRVFRRSLRLPIRAKRAKASHIHPRPAFSSESSSVQFFVCACMVACDFVGSHRCLWQRYSGGMCLSRQGMLDYSMDLTASLSLVPIAKARK
mmetsp:Transcript_139139/g.346834  ORF Transcript_139139/g.346834 Transcript_139139/m.346834 type:complete len:118 (-) Transcript_139139:69-422(-)